MSQDAYGAGEFTISAEQVSAGHGATQREAASDGLFTEILGSADLYEATSRVGFDVDDRDSGGLVIVSYSGKSYDQEAFLASLAPYAVDGSYLNWNDGMESFWQTTVEGGSLVVLPGKLVYTRQPAGTVAACSCGLIQ